MKSWVEWNGVVWDRLRLRLGSRSGEVRIDEGIVAVGNRREVEGKVR